jgi:hypothetical protein
LYIVGKLKNSGSDFFPRLLTNKKGEVNALYRREAEEHKIAFKYHIDEDLKGAAELEVAGLSTVLNFEVGQSDKSVKIVTKWSRNRFVDLDLTFKMTEDTFDGTLVVKTSVRRWESTTFRGR